MPAPKRSHRRPEPADSLIAKLAQRPQIEFEMEFFDAIIARVPDFAEVLQAQANDLTEQGRVADGLKAEERYVRLRPRDSSAHYHLACRYAVLQKRDQAISTLRRAVELGFRDFRSMTRDESLASIRKDPRFRQLVSEYSGE